MARAAAVLVWLALWAGMAWAAPPADLVAGAERGDGKAQLALAAHYLEQDGSAAARKKALILLRGVVSFGEAGDKLAAMDRLIALRAPIRERFPEVDDGQVKEALGSVGVALSRIRGREGEAVEVMIEEAWLLAAPAEITLKILYRHHAEGFSRHDPRILAYFRAAAAEGLPRAMEFTGEILLAGMGVAKDEGEGRRLLEASGFAEAHLILAMDAVARHDLDAAERHFPPSLEDKSPVAFYNFGVFRQQAGRHAEAADLFEKALKAKADFHAARLELARMHAEGWGRPRDPEKGAKLMARVAREADGRAAAIAQANLGLFHLEGRGLPKDRAKAVGYLRKAKAGGVAEAGDILARLGE